MLYILCYIDFSIFGDVGDFVNTVMLLRAYWGVSWQRWQWHQRRASAEVSRGNFNFFDIIIIDNVVIASVTPVVLCLHLQVPPLISQTWPAIEGRKYGGIGFKGVQSFFLSLSLQTPEKKFPETFLYSFCSVLSRRARPNASAQTSYIWRKKIKKRQTF